MKIVNTNANLAWLGVLQALIVGGERIAPRGQATYELPQVTVSTRLSDPVLTIPERGLNYRFMAAEARWIIEGQDEVKLISPYNSKIAAFSDDGQRFFGAYGPPYRTQLPYVIQKLIEDPDSRQAGLTLWRQNPPATKDVPCTVALFFQLRGGVLNIHVFMRSSDAWLGLPYDLFNFSMLGYHVLGFLNQRHKGAGTGVNLFPGSLFLTMASSHLYEQHRESAKTILAAYPDLTDARLRQHAEVPLAKVRCEARLLDALTEIADGARAQRWWLEPRP